MVCAAPELSLDFYGRKEKSPDCSPGHQNWGTQEENVNDDIKDIDEGGEEQSPCSLPMPRGCVECVVCRTQTSPISMRGRGGFVMKAGRQ